MSIDDDEPREITLERLLEFSHRTLIDGLRTGLPGQIADYDAGSQRASVQVLIQHGELVAGDRQVAPLPILTDVPVWFLGPGRGRITWPVAPGDLCWVMWGSSSMAVWKAQGGLVDPGDDTRHRITDAVCLVGGHDFAHVPTDAPVDSIVTHGLTRIGGSDAVSDIVVQLALTDFMAALASVAGANPQLAALQAALQALNAGAGWLARTSSAKAK